MISYLCCLLWNRLHRMRVGPICPHNWAESWWPLCWWQDWSFWLSWSGPGQDDLGLNRGAITLAPCANPCKIACGSTSPPYSSRAGAPCGRMDGKDVTGDGRIPRLEWRMTAGAIGQRSPFLKERLVHIMDVTDGWLGNLRRQHRPRSGRCAASRVWLRHHFGFPPARERP